MVQRYSVRLPYTSVRDKAVCQNVGACVGFCCVVKYVCSLISDVMYLVYSFARVDKVLGYNICLAKLELQLTLRYVKLLLI